VSAERAAVAYEAEPHLQRRLRGTRLQIIDRRSGEDVRGLLAAHRDTECERLREAIASAMTSLATGPMKDGYAYSVLEAALSPPTTEEERGRDS
jgi:hypothetical protein